MTDLSYDQTLFDRRFLNCFQRQAIVFLQKAGAPVSALTGAAYVSTDKILADVMCKQMPKYTFENDCLSDENLALIGWQQQVTGYESLAQARPALAQAIATSGFGILMGSVFYFPHNPEYRDVHLNHSIVVTSCEGPNDWQVFDDDPLTVLKSYRYPAHMVAGFFENNGTRLLRAFQCVVPKTFDTIRSAAIDSFQWRVRNKADKGLLLTEIADITDCAWRDPAQTAHHLRDCFLLLSGARTLTSHFLSHVVGDPKAAEFCTTLAQKAQHLATLMMKAEHKRHFDHARLSTLCTDLWALEQKLLDHLLHIIKSPA